MHKKCFEAKFIAYRNFLRDEIYRFKDCASIYRQIQDRKLDMLQGINIAPVFFNTVEKAIFTTIILWADKLFDERGERGLFNFLTFIEHNRKWITVAGLQHRNKYPNDHWMIKNRPPITAASIEADRKKIRALKGLRSFKLQRDKFHGHFDKEYAFERWRLGAEAPLLWPDLDEASDTMGLILNNYSSDFDGNVFAFNFSNIDDLSILPSKAIKTSIRNTD